MTQRLPDCDRCGHPANWHRLDDALNLDPTDPTVPFRCIGYDSEAPGPPPLTAPGCRCPAYVIKDCAVGGCRQRAEARLTKDDVTLALCARHANAYWRLGYEKVGE